MRVRSLIAAPGVAVALLAVAGCGGDESGGPAKPALEVTATTTQVADIARNVGGSRVEVTQILEPNSDPHDYEPRPSDARALTDAELVFRSGGEVDEWLGGLLENAGGKTEVVDLSESVERIEGGHAHHEGEKEHGGDEEHAGEEELDPHWWQDPANGIRAAAAIERRLIAADPAGRAQYERNARRYSDRLRRLDGEIAGCLERIPAAKRKLVTSHDALGYYATRYDIEVEGALIPSLSSQAQPSARDTQRLVRQIERAGVEAIFPESSLNPKLERAVARESGAKVGDPLWADTLGPKGSSGATYLGSLAANTASIVEGLSGGEQRCRPRA